MLEAIPPHWIFWWHCQMNQITACSLKMWNVVWCFFSTSFVWAVCVLLWLIGFLVALLCFDLVSFMTLAVYYLCINSIFSHMYIFLTYNCPCQDVFIYLVLWRRHPSFRSKLYIKQHFYTNKLVPYFGIFIFKKKDFTSAILRGKNIVYATEGWMIRKSFFVGW